MARQGMTQSDLARRCMVTQATISRWLSGTHDPRVSTAQQVMAVLGIRVVGPERE
jgi:transcriptional regulator with XRE-family HTH domain